MIYTGEKVLFKQVSIRYGKVVINDTGFVTVSTVTLVSLTKMCSDLDQLNHILGILGSPTQEDLQCIMNDKVTSSDSETVCFSVYVKMGWLYW